MFYIYSPASDQIHDKRIEKQFADQQHDIAYGNGFGPSTGFFTGKEKSVYSRKDRAEDTDRKIGQTHSQQFFRNGEKTQYRSGEHGADQNQNPTYEQYGEEDRAQITSDGLKIASSE